MKVFRFAGIFPAVASGVFGRLACEAIWAHDLESSKSWITAAIFALIVSVVLTAAVEEF